MLQWLREFLATIVTPADDLAADPTLDTPARYTLLSDAELSAIVANVGAQYTPAAQRAAEIELGSRGAGVANLNIDRDTWLLTLGTVADDDALDELTFAESPALREASRGHQEKRSFRSSETLKQMAAEHPRCAEPLLHYSEALRRNGQASLAEALLLERLPILRRKSPVAAALGDIAFERGDANAAIRWYATAIATAPSPSWVPLLRLGGFYRAVGDLDAAAALQAAANRAYGFQGVALPSEWLRNASAQSQSAPVRTLLGDLWDAYLADRVRRQLASPSTPR